MTRPIPRACARGARFLLPVALLAAVSAPLAAQRKPAPPPAARPVSTAEIDAHLRFLASDLLEGRAPGTRGGRLAAEYIAAQLLSFGLEPAGDNGSWFQQVPIDIVGARRETIRATARGRATAALRYPDDVVLWAGSASPQSAATAELVFAGYGASAAEYKWNDFKDVDVKGKILLVLVNDPPAPAAEPKLFGGRAMTYYGRWPYKFEEAERRGAVGALIVHTTERAGYPWHTVVGSWAKEQRMLPRDPKLPPPLAFRGWITDSMATALLAQAGLDLGTLRTQAESRDFRPVPTGITVSVNFGNTVEHLQSANVVGAVRGHDPRGRDDFVILSAHWDHLGIGPAVNGDSIYNGAEDNASGVAAMLAVARLAAQGPAPRRSLLFAFVTAEESGLLGSQFLAEHPLVPLTATVANLNVDGGNLLGRVKDLNVLGDTKSTLGPQLATLLRPRGVRITPEEFPERGAFYRSDHFMFAKAGIPSVSIGEGNDFEGRPAGWGTAQHEDYTSHRYHQPSDAYSPQFDLRGAAQLSGIVLDFARVLANSAAWPAWNAEAEFKRPARKSAM
ncbi:MAG: M20/M25/M40 family metallo-hydrolase [Gemmatimonadetes bacterium]|nr:M20/M25/M40 family metallo-hydrolase [Gemmatimonadota bacterium]